MASRHSKTAARKPTGEGGPEPLGLLWRRIDSDFADPLELDEGSRIGTPGLIEALRQGSLSLINALGSGVTRRAPSWRFCRASVKG